MAKTGSDKNTKNKSKHTKLMNRKISKVKQKELAHANRLKALKEQILKAKQIKK